MIHLLNNGRVRYDAQHDTCAIEIADQPSVRRVTLTNAPDITVDVNADGEAVRVTFRYARSHMPGLDGLTPVKGAR